MKFILFSFILLSSCSKTFVTKEVTSLENVKCESTDNCISSFDSAQTPFKISASNGEDNLKNILTIVKKYPNAKTSLITSMHLRVSYENSIINFIVDNDNKVIHYNIQLKESSFLNKSTGVDFLEKIRFDFFQNNF